MMTQVFRLSARLGFAGLFMLAACETLGIGGEGEGGDAAGAGDEDGAKEEGDGGDDKAGADEGGDGAAASDDGAGDGGSEPTGDQPQIAWNSEFASIAGSFLVTSSGSVIVVFEGGIEGVMKGESIWKKEGAFTPLLRLPDRTIATSTGNRVHVFDPNNGQDVFTVDIPEPPGWNRKKKKPRPPPPVIAIATVGSQMLVANSDARFYILDPPICAENGPACLRPAGYLDGEELEAGTGLNVANDGTRFLTEGSDLRGFDLGLDTVFELESRAEINAALPVGPAGLVIAAGGAASLLNLGRCRGAGLIKLQSAPVGNNRCVTWRYGEGLDPVAPAVVDEQTIAVNGGRRLQAVNGGVDAWKSPIDAVGRVLSGPGGLLYTLSVQESPAEFSVKAVSADKGTVVWKQVLPFQYSDTEIVVAENMKLDWQGKWVAAGMEKSMVVIEAPRPPAPAKPEG